MLDTFIGDAIAATPGFAGVAYETIDEGTVRLVMEAPELGRPISVEVGHTIDDGIGVLRLHTARSVEGEQEPPGDVIQQGLTELRRRWPEIVVQIRNMREGVNLEYETRILRRRSAGAESDEELAKDFVTVLPRLRDCVVRSFHFINVLCVASQVDVGLLEGGQDFALEEWEFVQECGGLETMRPAIDELCDMLETTRDDVLSEAIAALRRARLAEERTVAPALLPVQPAVAPTMDGAGQATAVAAAIVTEPIGLTLEELISFGP